MNSNINEIIKQVLEKLAEVQGGDACQKASQTASSEDSSIPLGISNRHIHLSQQDVEKLFGKGYQLANMKDLVQPGQFACKETVTVCGPKGAMEKIRVLGPVRSQTQVELLSGDNYKLGIKALPKMSGDLAGTPGVTVVGPQGSVQLQEGAIVAKRHIHMTTEEAKQFGVRDGQIVSIACRGTRPGILDDVIIRANDNSALECHLDTEEANGLGLSSDSLIQIVK